MFTVFNNREVWVLISRNWVGLWKLFLWPHRLSCAETDAKISSLTISFFEAKLETLCGRTEWFRHMKCMVTFLLVQEFTGHFKWIKRNARICNIRSHFKIPCFWHYWECTKKLNEGAFWCMCVHWDSVCIFIKQTQA